MPVGGRASEPQGSSPPVSTEPPAARQRDMGAGVTEVVEGGRERWADEGKRRSSARRKRKMNTNPLEYGVPEAQQVYAGNERDRGVNSAHQQQPHPDDHSSLNKRPCLDIQNGSYDQQPDYLSAADNGTGGIDHPAPASYGAQTASCSGSELGGGEVDDDILCVVKREQAKVLDLLAKCEEAMSEGMAYEAFFPVRIDEMLRATYSLEQSLLDQKEAIKEKLQEILGIL